MLAQVLEVVDAGAFVFAAAALVSRLGMCELAVFIERL